MDLRESPAGAAPTPRHPWELARAAFLLERLGAGVVGAGDRVLDVGAGDAWLAARVRQERGCELTCWDAHYGDEDLRRLGALGLAPTRTAPPGPFDLALLCDVLEHVDDERALLREVVARVRPGGRVLVTVPCWPALFSAHDRALQHHRRYTPAGLRALLEGSGLLVDEGGGLFHALLAPRALAVLAERAGLPGRAGGVGAWRGGAALSSTLTAMLRAEQRLSVLAARLELELPGLSAWALCTRPMWQSGSP